MNENQKKHLAESGIRAVYQTVYGDHVGCYGCAKYVCTGLRIAGAALFECAVDSPQNCPSVREIVQEMDFLTSNPLGEKP